MAESYQEKQPRKMTLLESVILQNEQQQLLKNSGQINLIHNPQEEEKIEENPNMDNFGFPSKPPETAPKGKLEVRVNIYDLMKANKVFHKVGLGAYHAGLEVNGVEYSGTESGLVQCKPQTYGKFGSFRQSLLMGYSDFTHEEFLQLIEKLRPDYPSSGDNYHLLKNNCQNFCDRVCKLLGVKGVPKFVTRTARMAAPFSFMVPQGILDGD